MKGENCQKDCLISAKEIIKKKIENKFTFKEIKEDFGKKGLKYADTTIRSALSNSYPYYHLVFETIYEWRKIKGYKIRLASLDDKDAKEEIGRRLKETEKKLGEIERRLKPMEQKLTS